MPTPPATPLFLAQDLEDLLSRPIEKEKAVIAERVVWGWVQPLTDLTDRPGEEITPALDAAVIELGAIFIVNPENLSRYELSDELSIYGAERKAEILRSVASGGTVAPGSAPKPVGSFPAASRYPDPATPFGWL